MHIYKYIKLLLKTIFMYEGLKYINKKININKYINISIYKYINI